MSALVLKEIVEQYLKMNGYDGLFNVWLECACKLDDLMPCGDPDFDCTAGHFVECLEDSDFDWCIGKKQ